jgi:hypothetical protein
MYRDKDSGYGEVPELFGKGFAYDASLSVQDLSTKLMVSPPLSRSPLALLQ